MDTPDRREASISRRNLLRDSSFAAISAAAFASAGCSSFPTTECGPRGSAVVKGRIKQSVVGWCFADQFKTIDKTCQVARDLGCVSVELAPPSDWATLKKYGLVCAIAPNGMPGAPFIKGFNNPKYHDQVIASTKKVIDACADAGFGRVIAFTGYKYNDAEDPKSGEISLEQGAKNCVEGFKKIVGYAEEKKVMICLEHLNTRDDSDPMKGHPGYQGDDVDYCVDIIKAVGSPNLKLLFDIYHVQIMNGDLVRRIHQHKDYIGHIHTAGNPGRNELHGETQEINYPAVMRALLDINYQGYVGQEFIPVNKAEDSLRTAVEMCDV